MSGHTSRPAALAPCSAYAAASAAGRQNAARTVISVLAVRSPQQVSTLAVVSRPIAGCRSSALPGRYGRLGPAIMQRENERKRLAAGCGRQAHRRREQVHAARGVRNRRHVGAVSARRQPTRCAYCKCRGRQGRPGNPGRAWQVTDYLP